MSERDAAALHPPADCETDPVDDSEPPTAAALTTSARQGQEQIQMRVASATDQAAASTQTGDTATAAIAATTAAVAVSPFSRLATVELQLIMRCCDQSTLIALAQCSRFALAAASHPFAWQLLSPIDLRCISPLSLSGRLRSSLLRHADTSLTWRLRSKAAVSAEQVAALAALPRLRSLTIESAWDYTANRPAELSDASAALLFEALAARIDHGGSLASLCFGANKIGQAGAAALAAFVERSRTLTSLNISDATDSLLTVLATALPQCRTLTSLELDAAECSMESIRLLAAFVQQSDLLATLQLRRFGLDDAGAIVLAAAVAQSHSLIDLELSGCGISDVGVEALDAALEQSGRIRKLDLCYNLFSSVGAAALARLLASDRCELTSLNVSGCRIGLESALVLANALRTIRTLAELRLSNMGCGDDGMAALLSALQRNPHCHLHELDLSHNSLHARHASAIAHVIARSVNLERLELRWCQLGNEEMAALAAAIGQNRALQHLDVWHNNCGVSGAAALAAAMAMCPTLTSLDVSDNKIGDAGMAALAPALLNLRRLDLYCCGLTAASATPLADLIECSRVLERLDVSSNKLEVVGVEAIAAALQSSSSLRILSLQSECVVSACGTAALAAALDRGWKATELRLDFNLALDDSGAIALAAATRQLGDRCTLTTLSLTDCGISARGALALVRAAMHTPRLRMLDMRDNRSISSADRRTLLAACGPQPHFDLTLPPSH